MLYHLIHRYLHDKLEFYLKNQCAFLSNSDFEDVISLTIAKCLEDLPLFQGRFLPDHLGLSVRRSFCAERQPQKRDLLPAPPLPGSTAFCIPIRCRSIDSVYSKRARQRSDQGVWMPLRRPSPDSHLGIIPKSLFCADCTDYAPETRTHPAALSVCLPDNAAEFSLLLLSQQFCIRATEKRTADERMIFLQLLLKQRMFSWFDSYDIYDEDGNAVFQVKGRLSWGHCLEIFDSEGSHVGTVKEEALAFFPRFALYAFGDYIGEIKKEFTLFKPVFTLNCNDWTVQGDWLEWDYQVVTRSGAVIMQTSKKPFQWADTYVIDIVRQEDALLSLMIVLAIDAAKCSSGN